jgi:GxxExxY protein
MSEKEELDKITQAIIGAAIQVHQTLGLGLLESAYAACLAFELAEQGYRIEKEKPLPLIYKTMELDCAYRLDQLVEDKVIVEVKAVDQFIPIHQAQVLSYLKLSGCKIELLINFNVKLLKNGIQRIINGNIY